MVYLMCLKEKKGQPRILCLAKVEKLTFSEGLREFITNRHDLQEMLKAGTKGHWTSNLKPYKMIIIMPVEVTA